MNVNVCHLGLANTLQLDNSFQQKNPILIVAICSCFFFFFGQI